MRNALRTRFSLLILCQEHHCLTQIPKHKKTPAGYVNLIENFLGTDAKIKEIIQAQDEDAD